MTDRTWTPDMIEILRQAWPGPDSCAAIGRQIGVSKNAILGKAKRLGLPERPIPIPRSSAKPHQAAARLPHSRVMPSAAAAVAVAAVPKPAVALRVSASAEDALRSPTIMPSPPTGGCKWPMWGHREAPTHRYCDKPQRDVGDAYCSHHMEKAHVRPARPEAA